MITDYRYKVMNRKSIAITAVLTVTMLTALFTTISPFSMNDAEGQIIIPIPGRDGCPVGYHRDILGTCVPDTTQPPSTPPSENRAEQNIVCSGLSYTCG
jgi:hypothetical protein